MFTMDTAPVWVCGVASATKYRGGASVSIFDACEEEQETSGLFTVVLSLGSSVYVSTLAAQTFMKAEAYANRLVASLEKGESIHLYDGDWERLWL